MKCALLNNYVALNIAWEEWKMATDDQEDCLLFDIMTDKTKVKSYGPTYTYWAEHLYGFGS